MDCPRDLAVFGYMLALSFYISALGSLMYNCSVKPIFDIMKIYIHTHPYEFISITEQSANKNVPPCLLSIGVYVF